MELACLDLEGVLVPEIWIAFAERTGIEELRATTRDIPDYNVLMKQRLGLLEQHGLKIDDIQDVISTLEPLPGAIEFIDWLRERFQVIILSDTFYEFSQPLMRQLHWPTLLCHRLVVDDSGSVVDYKLRQEDPKRASLVHCNRVYLGWLRAVLRYQCVQRTRSRFPGRAPLPGQDRPVPRCYLLW